MADTSVNLPPGFRFYPTDEELVVHFLHRKASLLPCHPDVIPDLELYQYDPWQLHGTVTLPNSQYTSFFPCHISHRNIVQSGLMLHVRVNRIWFFVMQISGWSWIGTCYLIHGIIISCDSK